METAVLQFKLYFAKSIEGHPPRLFNSLNQFKCFEVRATIIIIIIYYTSQKRQQHITSQLTDR